MFKTIQEQHHILFTKSFITTGFTINSSTSTTNNFTSIPNIFSLQVLLKTPFVSIVSLVTNTSGPCPVSQSLTIIISLCLFLKLRFLFAYLSHFALLFAIWSSTPANAKHSLSTASDDDAVMSCFEIFTEITLAHLAVNFFSTLRRSLSFPNLCEPISLSLLF